jgi:hemerythrin-like domain-containing protein
MDPITNLAFEHRLLEKSLFSIKEYLLTDIRVSKQKELETLLNSLGNMIDKIHFTKEEELFFPVIEKIGISYNSEPLNTLISQHVYVRAELIKVYRLYENSYFEALKDEISELFELIRAHGTLEYVVFFSIINNKLSIPQKVQLSNQFEDFVVKRIGTENYELSKATLIKTSELLFKQEYPDNTQELQNLVKALY